MEGLAVCLAMGRKESRRKERVNTSNRSMKSVKKGKPEVDLPQQVPTTRISQEQMMRKTWQKCLDLGKFLANPLETIDMMMEEEWTQKILSKFEGMMRLPRGRIFNQASQECWFEVYSEKQAFGFLPTRKSIKNEKDLREELNLLSRQIEALEAQNKKSYSF